MANQIIKVTNSCGAEVYYNAAVALMDDEIREALHAELAPCTEQEFFTAYCKAHEAKYGEPWCMDDPNPVY